MAAIDLIKARRRAPDGHGSPPMKNQRAVSEAYIGRQTAGNPACFGQFSRRKTAENPGILPFSRGSTVPGRIAQNRPKQAHPDSGDGHQTGTGARPNGRRI
jgi:hypothetical protein